MEKRNRDRLTMTVFCRIAPSANQRRSTWKRIENISGAGMLVVWSRGEAEVRPPRVGEAYTVELQLPPHPVFGQRALQFKAKVVRVFQQANGRVMAGLQTTQGRFRSLRPGAWPETCGSLAIN
ncbi:MAG TPA: PilZ domain-containing protein [Bryobacteraceae bacterium]|jgi:c-di-GMP-binding flagellar brake protein YcgR